MSSRGFVALFALTACKEPEPTDENEPPVATLLAPAAGASVHQGESLAFEGACADPEGDPVTHAWTFGGAAAPSTEAAPTVALSVAGSFVASYTCTDAEGSTSEAVTVAFSVTNEAPVATWTAPTRDVVVPQGGTVTFEGSCADPDDPDAVTLEWRTTGAPATGSPAAIAFDAAGDVTVTLACVDPWGAEGTATGLVTVDTPRALYRSTEVQTDYDDVLWADVAGAPRVLNDALFSPGGTIAGFDLVGSRTVLYVADHAQESHDQFYVVDRDAPEVATAITATPVGTGTPLWALRPGTPGFGYVLDQNVPDVEEAFYVDLSDGEPTIVELTPDLPEGHDVVDLSFSPTGRYVVLKIQYTDGSTRWNHSVVDLEATTPTAVTFEAASASYDPSIAFSDDEALMAWAPQRKTWVLDLATLAEPTPTTVALRTNGKFGGQRFAGFLPGTHEVVYTHDPDVSAQFEVFVADADGALAGGTYRDVRVSADLTAGTVGAHFDRRPWEACGDTLVYAAKLDGFSPSLFRVDVSDLDAVPAPIPLHTAFTGNEQAHVGEFFRFSGDCASAFYAAIDDGDAGTDTTDDYRLWAVDLATTAAPVEVAPVIDTRLSLSPTGASIAWMTRDADTNKYALWTADLRDDAALVDAATLRSGFLDAGEVADYAWTPDDKLLIATQSHAEQGLWLDDGAEVTRLSPLVDGLGDTVQYVTPTPNGNGVLYQSGASVWHTAFATPGTATLVNGPSSSNSAAMSTAWRFGDGATAFFQTLDGTPRRARLWSVPLDGSAPPALLSDEATNGSHLHDPADDSVIYASHAGVHHLRRVDRTGTTATDIDLGLADGDTLSKLLALSPTGAVLYQATVGGQIGTWIVDPTGGDPVLVEAATLNAGRPYSFSPSGRWLLYVVGGTPYRYEVVDLEAETLAPQYVTPPIPAGGIGSLEARFASDDAIVVAYDSVVADERDLFEVSLPGLTATRLHAERQAGEDVGLFQVIGDTVVFEKNTKVGDDSWQDRIYAASRSAPGAETLLTTNSEPGTQGVIAWTAGSGWVAWRGTATTTSGDRLFAVPVDGTSPPIGPLDVEDVSAYDLQVLDGPDGAWLAYRAGREDTTSGLYLVDLEAQASVEVSQPGSDFAEGRMIGDWLWFWEEDQGQCSPLRALSLTYPAAGAVDVGGDPVLGGCPDLPDAVD